MQIKIRNLKVEFGGRSALNLLHVKDLGDGFINVSWRGGNVEHECRQPIPLKDPLTEEDHQDLRWYRM
ncbi:MAG: hypothetical protein NTX42_05155 [Methanothrix sp.]|nr:hypothetical protein [Methanothrix sp.]